MAVVGADDEVIFSRVAEDVIEIVIGLAGDLNALVFQDVLRQLLAASRMAPRQIMNRIGNPLGANFDDPDAQLGETAPGCRH